MKKNLFKNALLFSAVMVFAACGGSGNGDNGGGKKDKLSMTPETTRISGQLSDCFEVVEGECSVPLRDGQVDGDAVWSIKVRRTEAPLPFEEGIEVCSYGTYRTEGQYYNVGFGLTIVDGNGAEVRTVAPNADGFDGPYSSEDIENICKLQPGEEGIIRWSVNEGESNIENMKFKLSSQFELKGEPAFDLANVILPSQIKDKVEVIKARKHVKRTGYPAMEISFKLLEKVNTAPLSTRYGQMWIVGVGQTEEGIDVTEILPSYKEWRTEDREGSQFKAFLESEPGETITLDFTGNKSDNVSADLGQVKRFKLKITHP